MCQQPKAENDCIVPGDWRVFFFDKCSLLGQQPPGSVHGPHRSKGKGLWSGHVDSVTLFILIQVSSLALLLV